jgi:hypothetical protein
MDDTLRSRYCENRVQVIPVVGTLSRRVMQCILACTGSVVFENTPDGNTCTHFRRVHAIPLWVRLAHISSRPVDVSVLENASTRVSTSLPALGWFK